MGTRPIMTRREFGSQTKVNRATGAWVKKDRNRISRKVGDLTLCEVEEGILSLLATHLSTSFPVLTATPCVITHIRGADPPGNPATISRYAGARSVALRPTLSNGLPFSSLLQASMNQEHAIITLDPNPFI